MKTVLTISTLLYILISCNSQDYDYAIDFRKITFPENNSPLIDSIDKKEYIALKGPLDIICETDKNEYKLGEKIKLTIKNQTNDTLYFFPGEIESARNHYLFSLYSDSIKGAYKNQLISQNPAMAGSLTYYNPSFIYLHFAGVDKFTSQKLGLNAFEQPLFPDEEISFSVTMPNRSGHYQFSIRQYFHNSNSFQLSNINNFLVSNDFLILNE